MTDRDSYTRKQEILRLQQEISALDELDDNMLQERAQMDDFDLDDDEEEVRRLEREIEELERDISITDERMSQLSFSGDIPSRESVDYAKYLKNPLKNGSTNRNRHRDRSVSPDAPRQSNSAVINRHNRVASSVAFHSPVRSTTASSQANAPPPPPPSSSSHQKSSSSSSKFSLTGRKSNKAEASYNRSASQEYAPEAASNGHDKKPGSTSGGYAAAQASIASRGRSATSARPTSSSSSSQRNHSNTVTDAGPPRHRATTTTGGTNRRLVASANSSYARRSESQQQSQSTSERPTILVKKSSSKKKSIFSSNTTRRSSNARESFVNIKSSKDEVVDDGEYDGTYNL